LPKPIIKSHPEEKEGVASVRELSKIWGFSFNIYAMAESIDFTFGTQFG